MALYAALHAPDALTSDAPEQSLALVAVGRRRGGPGDEVVRRRRRDRVDHRLEGLLVHVHLLRVCMFGMRNVRFRPFNCLIVLSHVRISVHSHNDSQKNYPEYICTRRNFIELKHGSKKVHSDNEKKKK